MVYVDTPVFQKPNGRKKYAHLTADSLEELHKFAESIGVKRHFFHRPSRHPHYDITEDQVTIAIAHGAKQILSKELVQIAKLLSRSV